MRVSRATDALPKPPWSRLVRGRGGGPGRRRALRRIIASPEDTCMHITVRNLAPSATASALRQLFAPYGAVGVIHIMINPMSGGSQGYGSVAMPDRQAAQAAMTGLHGTALAGWPSPSTPPSREPRGRPRARPGGTSRSNQSHVARRGGPLGEQSRTRWMCPPTGQSRAPSSWTPTRRSGSLCKMSACACVRVGGHEGLLEIPRRRSSHGHHRRHPPSWG